ncbi:hypothetical protein C8R48DRAFT_201839 [Suillus tomentosus]|nr:hypothetical protein C8R48DRAFT_201839 [Suillus tomentosus]
MLLRHCVLVLRSVLFGSLLAADPPADEALDILAFFVFSCSIPFEAWVAKMIQFNLGMMLNVAITRYRAGGSPGIVLHWELVLMVSPQNKKDDEKAGVKFVWAKAFVLH